MLESILCVIWAGVCSGTSQVKRERAVEESAEASPRSLGSQLSLAPLPRSRPPVPFAHHSDHRTHYRVRHVFPFNIGVLSLSATPGLGGCLAFLCWPPACWGLTALSTARGPPPAGNSALCRWLSLLLPCQAFSDKQLRIQKNILSLIAISVPICWILNAQSKNH